MNVVMRVRASLLIAMLITCARPVSAASITVTIDKLVFEPAEITIDVGDTVEWVNNDAFAHTATVKGGWEVSIPPHASAIHVMNEAEVVDYYCRFHPNMKGRIVVKPR